MSKVTLEQSKLPIQTEDGATPHSANDEPPHDPAHHDTKTNGKVHEMDPHPIRGSH